MMPTVARARTRILQFMAMCNWLVLSTPASLARRKALQTLGNNSALYPCAIPLLPPPFLALKTIGVDDHLNSSSIKGFRLFADRNGGSLVTTLLPFFTLPIAVRKSPCVKTLVPSSKTAQCKMLSPIVKTPSWVALRIFSSITSPPRPYLSSTQRGCRDADD